MSSYTSEEVKSYLWNFLRNKGLPENSVSAVMGNIYIESDEFQIDVEEYGGGGGYGLCQWTASRRTQLESYGISFNHQLYFLWSELTGENTSITNANFQWIEKSGYLSHNDFMEGNGTIAELTNAFCFCWERPNFDKSHINIRVEKANEYYEEYGGSGEGEIIEPPTPKPIEPPTEGTTVRLKNNYRYGMQNSLYGKKIIPTGKYFTLDKIIGDIAYIKQDKRIYKVNKNNLIYIDDGKEENEENEENEEIEENED